MGLAPLRARVCSDLHLDARAMTPPRTPAADVALVPGDALNGREEPARLIEALEGLLSEPLILFTPGNHEGFGAPDWDEMIQSLREASAGSRVRVLHRDAIEHQGRRFLGATLWSDFRFFGQAQAQRCMEIAARAMPDYRAIKTQGRLITPEDTLAWHQLDLAFLTRELALDFDGPTIVLTHHAPHPMSVAPQYAKDALTACFASRLPPELLARARLWAHGHVHTSFDYPAGPCRVVCNPRGYSLISEGSTENPPFDADLTLGL